MNRLHCITVTNAVFADALDWADLGQRIREATDDAMPLATSILDLACTDATTPPTPFQTDEVNQR